MKKHTIQLFCVLLVLASFAAGCKKNLNDNLFNPSKLDSYKLDDYGGTVDFRLNEDYAIPSDKVRIFPLKSIAEGETDSTKIWAIYIGSFKTNAKGEESIANDTVIVYFHGNKDHMDFYWQRAKLLAHTGGKNNYGVLMIDYRGYGMSDGKSTEETMYADGEAAMQWLRKMNIKSQKFGIYGFSLGCAVATKLCYSFPAAHRPGFMILEAPFASVATLVNDGAALNIDPLFFSTYKCDNNKRIKNIQQPFLWMHGTKDKFIPMETNGEVLYKNYTGTIKDAQRVEGADHNNVPQTLGFEKYNQVIFSFLGRKK